MKIIVAGSRDIVFVDIPSIVLKSDFTITELVSGGANGVDTLGEQYARQRDIPIMRTGSSQSCGTRVAEHII